MRNAGAAPPPVWDAATVSSPQSLSLSNKRLTQSISQSAIAKTVRATRPITTGKWYWEVLCSDLIPAGGATSGVGICDASFAYATSSLATAAVNTASLWASGGAYKAATNVTIPMGQWAASDVLQLAFDATTGNLWFGRNGTFSGAPATGGSPAVTGISTGVTYYPAATCWSSNATHQVVLDILGVTNNNYSPPSGFTLYGQ
jgi:hypothetical protein